MEALKNFIVEGHLGGYVQADEKYLHGDLTSYTPDVWKYLIERYI